MFDMLNIDNETFANAYECLVAANGMLKEGLGDLSQLDASALELINKEYKDRRGKNKSGERLKDIEDECFDLERRMHDTIVLLAAMESESATYFGGRFSSSLDELGFEDADVFAEWRDVEAETTVVATTSFVTGVTKVGENIGDAGLMIYASVLGSEEVKTWAAEEVKRDKSGELYDNLYGMASSVMDIGEDIAYGAVHNISTVAGQIAGNLALNAVGGPITQGIVGGLQAYGSGSENALQNGTDFDTANAVGMLEGIVGLGVGVGLDVLADGAKSVQTVTDALKTTAKGVGLAVTEPIYASGVEYMLYGEDLVDENGEKLYNSFSEYYTESGGALNTFIAAGSTAIRIGGASLKGASASADSSSSEIPTTKAPDASSAKTPDTPRKYKYDDLSGTLIPDSEPTKVKPEPVILDYPEAGDNIGVDFGKNGDLDIDTPSKPVIEVDSPPKNVFVDDDGMGNFDMDDYKATSSVGVDTSESAVFNEEIANFAFNDFSDSFQAKVKDFDNSSWFQNESTKKLNDALQQQYYLVIENGYDKSFSEFLSEYTIGNFDTNTDIHRQIESSIKTNGAVCYMTQDQVVNSLGSWGGFGRPDENGKIGGSWIVPLEQQRKLDTIDTATGLDYLTLNRARKGVDISQFASDSDMWAVEYLPEFFDDKKVIFNSGPANIAGASSAAMPGGMTYDLTGEGNGFYEALAPRFSILSKEDGKSYQKMIEDGVEYINLIINGSNTGIVLRKLY